MGETNISGNRKLWNSLLLRFVVAAGLHGQVEEDKCMGGY